MKYFGKYTKDDILEYSGSGVHWNHHLNENGDGFVSTQWISDWFLDPIELQEFALSFSELFDIVNSDDWANMKYENGLEGGDTVSMKIWITNGTVDKYHNKSEIIPIGWMRGRTNCVFNDANFQKEMSGRVDRKLAGVGIKLAWQEGRVIRDHSRCGTRGESNPSKLVENRRKIGRANGKKVVVDNICFYSIKDAAEFFGCGRVKIMKRATYV